MAYRDKYDAVARLLRIALASQESHVIVVNGGQAGYWIEVARGDYYFTTSDINGPWGLTIFGSQPLEGQDGRRNPLSTGLEVLGGVEAYWLSNHEDGPEGDDVLPERVLLYLTEKRVIEGDHELIERTIEPHMRRSEEPEVRPETAAVMALRPAAPHPPVIRIEVQVYEVEHSGDLERAYDAFRDTGVPFGIISERIVGDSETALVEISVNEQQVNNLIRSVKNGVHGDLFFFGRTRAL